MKVALIRPNYKAEVIKPHLGLGYISAYLNERGIECSVIDGLGQGLTDQRIAEECAGADVAGITCMSDYYPEVIELTRLLKSRRKTVIIGGPHPTVMPGETLVGTGADYVVAGEGEEAMHELALRLKNNASAASVPGVMSRERLSIIKRPPISDLDSLPFPYLKMDPTKYMKARGSGRRAPAASIISTRGCAYECAFCAVPEVWGRRVRYRSPRNVVDEIEYLVNTYGVREVHFEDDSLTSRTSHIEGICELILERKLKIDWAVPNGIRPDAVNRKMLGLMKKSGCYLVSFGVESANDTILERIKRGADLATITYAIHEAHNAGLMTRGFFTFGLPGETERSIENSVNYAEVVPLDSAEFGLFEVIPGSGIWHDLKGGVKAPFSREVTWVHETSSKEALYKARLKASKNFSLRTRQVFSALKSMRLLF